MYRYTTSAQSPVIAHADHNRELWHAYLSADYPSWVNGSDTGLCCHTCQLVIVDRTGE